MTGLSGYQLKKGFEIVRRVLYDWENLILALPHIKHETLPKSLRILTSCFLNFLNFLIGYEV